MTAATKRAVVQAGAAVMIFASGVFCGASLQRPAEAQQMGDMMKKAGELAGEQGGSLSAAAKLATSITGLQQHVGDLQKDVDGLKKVQSLLGG
jgi:hypothetical protein